MKHDYGFIYNTKDLFFEPAFIAWRFKLCWSRLPFPLPVFELSLYRWLSQVSSFRTLAPFSHHDHDWYLCCEQGRLDFCFSSQIISSVFFFFFFFFSSVLLPGLFSSRWFIIYPFSWQKFLRKAHSWPYGEVKNTWGFPWSASVQALLCRRRFQWRAFASANWCNVSLAGHLTQDNFPRTLFQYNEWQRLGK